MQTPEQRVQNKIIKELKSLQEKGYPIFLKNGKQVDSLIKKA